MPNTQTFVPRGFTAGRHPMISVALASRVDRIGRHAGPQRLVVLRAAGAKPEAVEEFFADKPLWGARVKAPGLWEIDAFVDHIPMLTERKDLFQWVDVATRFAGKVVSNPAATALVRVAGEGAEKAVRSLGGTVTTKAPGTVDAKMPAAKMAEFLRTERVEAVEVLGAA